jgi:hypothetical protein
VEGTVVRADRGGRHSFRAGHATRGGSGRVCVGLETQTSWMVNEFSHETPSEKRGEHTPAETECDVE